MASKMDALENAVRDALSFVEAEYWNHPRTNDSRYDRLKHLKAHLERALATKESNNA